MSGGKDGSGSVRAQPGKADRMVADGCGILLALVMGTGAGFAAGWFFESRVAGVIAGLFFSVLFVRALRGPDPPKSDVYAPAGKVLCPGCKDTWIEVARKPWKCKGCGRVMTNREVSAAIEKGAF